MSGFETLLFCTSHVAGEPQWQQRYRRWLQHHAAIDWGDARIAMIDDASPWVPPAREIACHSTQALPPQPASPLMLRFSEHLGRPTQGQYPGWWRSFLYSVIVAQHYGCRRIIHVESDTYVLTRRMVAFLRGRERGWTAFWCPRWGFPETCVQVICEDSFSAMHSMWNLGWLRYANQCAEHILPFTEVVRDPHGNRYGETRTRIPSFADFAAQVTPRQQVWFR